MYLVSVLLWGLWISRWGVATEASSIRLDQEGAGMRYPGMARGAKGDFTPSIQSTIMTWAY